MTPSLSRTVFNQLEARRTVPTTTQATSDSLTHKPIASKEELQAVVDANLVKLIANTLNSILKSQNERLERFLEDVQKNWAEIEKWDAIRRSHN